MSDSVIYKSIPSAPNYQISNDGAVRRCEGDGWRHLALVIKKGGYLVVTVVGPDGSHQQRKIHTLVIEAFGGAKPESATLVRHLNGMPWDNRIENLAWGTHVDNEEDKRRHGRMLEGERNHASRLTREEVVEIKKLISSGYGNTDIGRRFGVSGTAIRYIAIGRNRKNG